MEYHCIQTFYNCIRWYTLVYMGTPKIIDNNNCNDILTKKIKIGTIQFEFASWQAYGQDVSLYRCAIGEECLMVGLWILLLGSLRPMDFRESSHQVTRSIRELWILLLWIFPSDAELEYVNTFHRVCIQEQIFHG